MLEGRASVLINICNCTDCSQTHEPLLPGAGEQKRKIQKVKHAWVRMDPRYHSRVNPFTVTMFSPLGGSRVELIYNFLFYRSSFSAQ